MAQSADLMRSCILLLIATFGLFISIDARSSLLPHHEVMQRTSHIERSDPFINDHSSYLLFANDHVDVLDTKVHHDVSGKILHPFKTPHAFFRAAKHALGLHSPTIQSHRSVLRDMRGTKNQHQQPQHLMRSRRQMRTQANNKHEAELPEDGVDEQIADDTASGTELELSYLVHFADGIDLNETTKEKFETETKLKLGEYFPHRSYIVVAYPSQINELRQSVYPQHDFVDWMAEFPVDAKVVTKELSDILHAEPVQQLTPKEKEDGTATGTTTNENDPNNVLNEPLVLNIQLQPVSTPPHTRTLEQLHTMVDAFQQFLTQHAFDNFLVRPVPNRRNNLLQLRLMTPTVTKPRMRELLKLLSEIVEVFVIELKPVHKYANAVASMLTQSGTVTEAGMTDVTKGRPIWNRGLKGENQIVGAADSGVDWDHCMFNGASSGNNAPASSVSSPAQASSSGLKVFAYIPFGDNTDQAGGHGTHVAGSIVGNAMTVTTDNGEIAVHSGEAPNAQLYFQDIGVGETLSGLDNVGDLGSGLFDPAYNQGGARIHSNSWGSSQNTYTTEAQSIDDFIFQNGGTSDMKMLILVAAGNDGLKQGSVESTVGSPATAKNILAVGASQTTNEGWLDSVTYTDWNAKSVDAASQLGYSSSTFDCCSQKDETVLNYCCQSYVRSSIESQPQQHNEGNMADFSSRGPTADGRVKPEIVAPGQYIISAKSDGKKSSINQCSSATAALLAMQGTSMATPTLAGNAVIVRQFLTEGWYGSGTKGSSTDFDNPSAALMSAILINGAQSLTGQIDPNNDGKSTMSLKDGIFPLSVFQGFGRVTLDRSLHFSDETRYGNWYEDQRTAIATNQDEDYCIDSTSGSGQVKATLVWHDAPGSVGAGVAAVNNLDLYMGSSDSDAVAANFVVRRDTLNNAESALFNANSGQKIFIKIRGINVPQGPQRYALVFSGPFARSSVKQGASVCGSASKFQISSSRFAEATESDHFPLGPVVGGAVGGAAGLAIIAALARFCYQRYQQGKII